MTNLRDRRNTPDRPITRVANARVPRADQYQVYNRSLVNQTPRVANGQPSSHTDEVYKDGYVHGQEHEHHIVEEKLQTRDNENAARGMLLGIVFTSLAGAALAALFIANNRPPSSQVGPTIVAPAQSPLPAANPQPDVQVRERVIERTEVVPVPQPQAPTITTPQSGATNQQGATNQAPVTQSAPTPQGQTTQPQTQTTQPTQVAPSQSIAQPQGATQQGVPQQGVPQQGASTPTNQIQGNQAPGTDTSSPNRYILVNPGQ